jgi:parvulin-like peptidyl-prolyl isomerase
MEQRLRFQQANPPLHQDQPRWRITAAHILVDSEAFARQCIAWLAETVPENQHACFENLAAMYSTCGSCLTHGVIGAVEPGQTDLAFERALCSLRPGEWYPEPVETAWGWHVIARIA